MKLSFKAFLRYLDFQGSAKELADTLSDLGFPNDGMTHIGEGLSDVVVGKVLEKAKHPEADRLNLLKVDVGSEVLPIVCGAHNMEVGSLVALAPVGVKVPGKDGAGLLIKEAKIRGQVSKGMCCAESELRLPSSGDGIWLLNPEKVPEGSLGKKVGEFYDFEDYVLEVDVTPNRGDAMSVRGLAREVGAKLGLKLKPQSTLKFKMPSGQVKPSIEKFEDAPGFLACLVQGVRVQETPKQWVHFLEAFGARSLSNLIDITNIVLFEMGHPVHFFDADLVKPESIHIRRAKAGEELELLTGKTVQLSDEDLVVADETGVLSLAGVMGGAKTGVRFDTKNILIEVACFDPKRIRNTAKRYGLSSESSQRFEKGLTPFRLEEVAERCLGLLKELSQFESASGTKISQKDLLPKSVLWDRKRIESKLGTLSKSDDEIFEMLRRLDYGFEPKGSAVQVFFPWYRTDVEVLEDVMEDIARLIGYENLEKKILQTSESAQLTPKSKIWNQSDELLDRFVAAGFVEAIHLSFTSPEVEEKLGLSDASTRVTVKNPIHSEKSQLRTRILPQLLERARMNAFHGEDEILLVETGPVFSKGSGSDRGGAYENSPFIEEWGLACVWLPRPLDLKKMWALKEDPFFTFKGLVEKVLRPYQSRIRPSFKLDIFHPNRKIEIGNGFAGEVHPSVQKLLDLPQTVFALELLFPLIEKKRAYAVPTQFPAIDLDASFLVSKEMTAEKILSAVSKMKISNLEWVHPYDLYEGSNLPAEKKSLTFAMRYQSSEKTLTLEEVKKEHDKLVQTLIKNLGTDQIALR